MRRQAAIDTITGYTLVRSASLTEQGNLIYLKLVVNPIATDDHTRNLGDNFVRIAKSLLDEGHPPSKRIGPGNYDYNITVYWWPD